MRICEVALEHGTDAEGRKPAVAYVIRRDDISEGLLTGVLDPPTRDRILCDASISRIVTGPDDVPLNAGRGVTDLARPRSAGRSSCGTGTADGRDVRSRPPGPTCTTSSTGNTAARPPSTTACSSADDITPSSTPTRRTTTGWTYTFADQRFRAHRPDGTELHAHRWITAV